MTPRMTIRRTFQTLQESELPTVHLIPIARGMAPDEVVGRIQGGWQLLGRQAVQRGASIATPGRPDGPALEDADVWMLDEPMIPQAMVAMLILQAMGAEDPLEFLAKELYGISLAELSQAIEEAKRAREQNSGAG